MPLQDERGNPITSDASAYCVQQSLSKAFADWCRSDRQAAGEIPKQKDATTGLMIQTYIETVGDQWQYKTLKKNRLFFSRFEEYFPDTTLISDVDVRKINAWREWMLDMGTPKGAASATMRFMDGAFAFWNKLQSNPLAGVQRIRTARTETHPLFTVDETKRILEVVRGDFPWFYPAVLLIVIGGLRTESVCLLRVEDFDVATRTLNIPPEIAKRDKGGKLLLPEYTACVISDCIRDRAAIEPLVTTRRGGWLYANMFQATPEKTNGSERKSPWLTLLEKANVHPRPPKYFRKAVDTNLVNELLRDACTVTNHTVRVSRKHYFELESDTQCALMHRLEVLYGLDVNEGNLSIEA